MTTIIQAFVMLICIYNLPFLPELPYISVCIIIQHQWPDVEAVSSSSTGLSSINQSFRSLFRQHLTAWLRFVEERRYSLCSHPPLMYRVPDFHNVVGQYWAVTLKQLQQFKVIAEEKNISIFIQIYFYLGSW